MKKSRSRLCCCLFLSWLTFTMFGCDKPETTDAADNSESAKDELVVDGPLRVVVLDDEPLASVLEREWRSISDYEIEISNQATTDYLEVVANGGPPAGDVLVFPSSLLGQLADQRLLRPMLWQSEEAQTKYQQGEIYRSIRRGEVLWDRRPYAVSFGSPVLMLLHRTDFVPEAPQTWSELNQLVDDLGTTLPEDVSPLVQPSSEGWPARMLIVRAAGYLYDKSKYSTVFNFSTMEPRVGLPAFQRAATEYQLSQGSASKNASSQPMSPQEVLDAFLDGKCAMAITWLTASRPTENVEALDFPVDISDLPGSSEKYLDHRPEPVAATDGSVTRVTVYGTDGRLGAVTRNAKNAALAYIFLSWATGPEQSRQLCPRSSHSAPFRLSHESAAQAWSNSRLPPQVATKYVALTKEALNRSTAIQFPRLPGQQEYVRELDQAMRTVLSNEENPDVALGKVVDNWNTITDRLDREKQKSAYRRSLGLSTK